MSKHFQQSDFWCGFKCAHGWKSINQNNINILTRDFRKGPFSFSLAYIPMAPEQKIEIESKEDLISAEKQTEYIRSLGIFASKIKSLLPKNTICARFDIPLDLKDVKERGEYLSRLSDFASAANVNLKKPANDIQPPDSTFLDLSLSESDLLKQMKERCRRNIKKAEKNGVSVRAVTFSSPNFESDLNSFYALYKETAARDGIGLHPLSYYSDLIERGEKSKGTKDETKITLYIASHENDDLGAIITLFQKDEAVYLYGCSSNKKRSLMPNYLLQWTAIKDAKNYGSKIYDFYGIPPTGSENHPMHGLYLFKTSFGGQEIHRPGSVDIPMSKIYPIYILAENFRSFWHKKIMKKLRGR